MTELALAEPSKPPKPASKHRISPKLAQAIDLLLTGACKYQKDAAARVGLDVSYLSRALAKGHVRVFYERRARETIAQGTIRGTARLIALMDASSEHVSLDAVKHTLSIAGIAPPDRSQPLVNIAISPGYVVKLRHADASHAVASGADGSAQVIDNVEDDQS